MHISDIGLVTRLSIQMVFVDIVRMVVKDVALTRITKIPATNVLVLEHTLLKIDVIPVKLVALIVTI